MGWGYDNINVKARELPALKSSIVDYQNQKEEKYSKKKLIEIKDHQLFFEENLKLPAIETKKNFNRLPPGLIFFYFLKNKRFFLFRRNFSDLFKLKNSILNNFFLKLLIKKNFYNGITI